LAKKVPAPIVSQAVQSLADLLMEWGFEPKMAFKASEEFWSKHKNKIGEVYI